ncbi:GNAT family N-acetyltransferase [Dactylosporangium sp. McL0621]|uniref:GNAT family N-acetyltransferase n=1 Tax=Dactylosporangium sp. McL0621 TaxID=3415678 RepID=UPI003CECC60D
MRWRSWLVSPNRSWDGVGGYHLARPDASSMLYLHRLEVASEHRRQGIGRALLRAFMSAGAQAGATKMFFTTGQGNARARALYESLGGGLAAQGPTVSYWFQLHPVAGPEAVQAAASRALLLTGVAGVGKSTVADAVGRVLTEAGHITAVVDTDMLAQFGPPRSTGLAGGRSYDELKRVNLASVWSNFRTAGARFLVAAAIIDTVAERERYAQSLAGCDVLVVKLIAEAGTVRRRLRQRDTGPKLKQHLDTLEQHGTAPTSAAVEDFTVTNDRAADEVATSMLVRAGWIGRDNQPTGGRTPQQ